MLRYFKFLRKSDVDYLLSGSLKFGRLRYYRLLEAVTNDSWIGDINEGRTTTVIDHIRIGPGYEGKKAKKALETAGILEISEGNTFIASNLNINMDIDCFVMSLSVGDFIDLSKIPSFEVFSTAGYDGCVEIMDIDLICKIIRDATFENGRLVSEVFDVSFGKVEYTDNKSRSFNDDFIINPGNPLVKGLNFAGQNEVRIVLTPYHPIEKDSIIINIYDKLDLFVERILGDVNLGEIEFDNNFALYSKNENVSNLFEIIGEWSAQKVEIETALKSSFLDQMRMSNDEWFNHTCFVSDQIECAFSPFRKRIVSLYWTMRSHKACPFVDEAILREQRSSPFIYYISRYGNNLRSAEA